MKVLTFSRYFPKGHPRQGEPTFFMEKILSSLGVTMKTLPAHLSSIVNDFQMLCAPEETKHTTIRAGERFKPGDMVSLRVWSDKPYRSKQIEFAQVEVKKTWKFIIYPVWDDYYVDVGAYPGLPFCRSCEGLRAIATNDGLSIEDFISWFAIHPKKKGAEFRGTIISWSDTITY